MSGEPLHFAHPEWIGLLWAWLGLVVVLVLLERRGSDAIDQLIGSALRERLVVRPSRWRRMARLALLTIAGAALCLALMQPQWGLRTVATPRVGAEIMIAIDVSRSMLADDAKPSRLERAKAEIRDLLPFLSDDHVGLIAFAGRASVLSPMTPDKSFLRLALDGAGPHSVSRGGTRLAEPILRAVAGFGDPGPAQRALILITDGEDHDSFALDAAKQAAEAGIKIIAIGFGDEAGSEIHVRDPRTGARTLVRDAEGKPVISRLDGEFLRELALVTDGAFVPAGTGVLDLASIYDAHIRRLTRGQLDARGRTIRDEMYQPFLLVALLCLVGAVTVHGGRRTPAIGSGAMLLVGLLVLTTPPEARAQAPGAPSEARAQAPAAPSAAEADRGPVSPAGADDLPPLPDALAPPADDAIVAASPTSDEATIAPRERFNRGNAALAEGDPEAAATQLRGARRDAVDDPELRYAATYNLGLAAAARAEALRAEDPERALEALYEAADWFREAAGARPDEIDPRHNLDVTLRRALILADEIARAGQRDVEAELDELIEAQRSQVADSAALLEEVARAGELEAAERLRPAFRDAATAQRVLRAQADALAERIARDREAILAVPEETRSPEDSLRAAQLEGVLVYLDSAIERMGQTRRQLRQRRAERAYRRGSAALGELKRARDQLRDPVEQIGVLLEEVARLASATGALAQEARESAVADENPLAGEAPLPAFLSAASVEEQSRRIESRVRELGLRFAAAAEQVVASEAAADDVPASGTAAPQADALLREALVEAAPLVAQAGEAISGATAALAETDLESALAAEASAGEALAAAQERFFDLRRLLDRAHDDEARIAEIAAGEAPEIAGARDEYQPLLAELQTRNLERAERLARLLERERATRLETIEAQHAQAGGPPPEDGEPDPLAAEEQRFALAESLRLAAKEAMQRAADELGAAARDATGERRGSGPVADWSAVAAAAGEARDTLDALRSLFFSIVEHLQALARDQLDLTDRTRDAMALATTEAADDPDGRGPETRARSEALAGEQAALGARGGAIADALLAQSESAAAQASEAGPPPAGPVGEDQDPTERLRRAAEQVAQAQLAMGEAETTLRAARGPLEPAEEAQTRALESLRAALELLAPPPPPEPGESQQQQQQPSPSSGDQQESPSAEPEPSGADADARAGDDPQAGDPSALLQGVRDREAERRRARERDRERLRAQPVEKDW